MTTLKTTLLGCAAVCAAVLAPLATAQRATSRPAVTTAPASQAERAIDPYLLDTCAVSGGKLGSMGDAIVKVYAGREVRFCCGGCIKRFEGDQAGYWKKVDAKIIERQMPFYPLETCIVSGEKLGGEMGDPIDFVYNNRLVRLCCKGCKGDFMKDPNPFLVTLDAAVIAKQSARYPLKTCPVSGGALGSMGKPVEKVYGNRLVRFCCGGCVKKFTKNPTAYVATIDTAWKEKDGITAAQ